MIKFDVHDRFSNTVKFTAEIDCDESESDAVKRGLVARRAVKANADLSGADLYGADLYGATGINNYIKCIQIETYQITYTAEVIQIGCERHTHQEWWDFDDLCIRQMDGRKALDWWSKYKAWLFDTIALCPAKPTGFVSDKQ